MKIYFARSISGCKYSDVVEYYKYMSNRFSKLGAKVYHPMIGKEELRCDIAFKSHGYENIPCSSNHAIAERDLWMVEQADIVFVDLEATSYCKENVSIGSCCELAIAHWLRKHTIVILSKNNIHNHSFILEFADVIFETWEDAIEYLEKMIRMPI